MKALQELASKLLSDGTVKVVIGYEQGPRGVRPAFITDPAQTSKLIFDRRCTQNLATYLNPRRKHIAALGKAGVVVKGCDARAVAGLIREQQITRDSVVIIAVRCGGVLEDPTSTAELTTETTSPRCGHCQVREPKLHDHLLGELPPAPPVNPRRTEQIAALEKMSAAERMQYWNAQLERCVRCHACREACPMCFCVECRAERALPQWVDPSPTARANRAWTMMRVMHQAGRCVDCMECERACPSNIPLGLLARYIADSVEQRYGYKATDDPGVPAPLGVFRTDDGEEFIR
jgi:formate dehydrogenase (coenzyme F420) beta subunit